MTDPIVLDKLAYSLQNFADAVDVSVDTIQRQIGCGELVPSYVGSKPLITREEGIRWLRTRPAEKAS